MAYRAALAICAALVSVSAPRGVAAQAAAESAIILSTTGTATAEASRSLGSSISRSLGGATGAIRASRSGSRGAVRTTSRRRSGGVRVGGAIPASGDVLEGTDAPTYRLANGASIRVSGGMSSRAPQTVCESDCPADQAPE